MFNSSLCDYSDAYIPVKGILTVAGQGANGEAKAADKNKQVTCKNCTIYQLHLRHK